MNIIELRDQLNETIERINEWEVDPSTVEVSMQIDEPDAPFEPRFTADTVKDVLWDNNGYVGGCVIYNRDEHELS